MADIVRQRRETHQRFIPIQSDHPRQLYSWEDDERGDRSRSYRVRRRLNADGDELVSTVNLEPESPRSVEPLWDVPRRRRFPIAPTPPTVDDSYRERRRDENRQEPEAIVFSRVTSPSDSEPHSIPMNSRRLPSRRRGWARLDPDGNEISTDEEEMIERARTITRRNNPQPFFNLFRPVVRGSSDNPANPRGDNSSGLEAHIPSRSDNASTVLASDAGEGSLEDSYEAEPEASSAANYINPLPMPLHEMICSPNIRAEAARHDTKRKPLRRAIQVSPSAHLAGR